MCQSVREGGQRCASHSAARLGSAAGRLQEALASGNQQDIAVAREQWEVAAAEYASTPTGERALAGQAQALRLSGDVGRAMMVEHLVRRGLGIRAANYAARVEIRARGGRSPERVASCSKGQGSGRLLERLGDPVLTA